MFKRILAGVAAAMVMAANVHASSVTLMDGQPVAVNFSQAAPAGAEFAVVSGFFVTRGCPNQDCVVTLAFFSELDLTGTNFWSNTDRLDKWGINTAGDSWLGMAVPFSNFDNPFSARVTASGGDVEWSMVLDYYRADPTGGPFIHLGSQDGGVVVPNNSNNVPEPGSLSLVALAAAGLVASRRRRGGAAAPAVTLRQA